MTTPPGTHKCLKTTCERQVPDAQIACPQHYAEVSPTIRRAIIRTRGEQRREAVADADHQLNDTP